MNSLDENEKNEDLVSAEVECPSTLTLKRRNAFMLAIKEFSEDEANYAIYLLREHIKNIRRNKESIDLLLTLAEEKNIPFSVLERAIRSRMNARTGEIKVKSNKIKYKYIDALNQAHTWSGRGRMPSVFANLLHETGSLDAYLVTNCDEICEVLNIEDNKDK